jgi:hypothetical protein
VSGDADRTLIAETTGFMRAAFHQDPDLLERQSEQQVRFLTSRLNRP